uniref:Uncharacterized protein n=1 Tax=Eutreptiella gymnastica TaxID=73025 RepID=A0A6U8JH60_9EUGL
MRCLLDAADLGPGDGKSRGQREGGRGTPSSCRGEEGRGGGPDEKGRSPQGACSWGWNPESVHAFQRGGASGGTASNHAPKAVRYLIFLGGLYKGLGGGGHCPLRNVPYI